jgi:DNA-directed RNA polymerase subunit RPC12/RpoP
MSNKEINVNRCTVCKTEFPLSDTIEVCPYCDGEILFDVPKRKSLLKKILDYKFTFSIKPKYERNKDKTDYADIKIKANRPKKKKPKMQFSLSAVKIALIAGIVILAITGTDGWGWLVFILIITSD